MAKKKPSALEALARLNDERRALEDRAAAVKRAAALELGTVVLDAGGAAIGPLRLRDLIARVAAIGVDAALHRLSAKGDSPASGIKPQLAKADPAEVQNG